MTLGPVPAPRIKGHLIQFMMLLSINVPTVSFGLAMGWVSLASGAGDAGGALVGAAAATFAAGLLGVPLGARALLHGRRPALAATSGAFAVCWALTLVGGWWMVAGRLCAGVAGAVAWCVAPLLGREMVSARAAGAAAAAPVLAHNLGMLLMYGATCARLQHSTVVASCLALSALHCGAALLAPESPAYLAAAGKHEEAAAALAWLRGLRRDHPALAGELRALPAPAQDQSSAPLKLVKEMLSERGRRRAFVVALLTVVGQEACGVLTLLQFAERVFLLAGGEGAGAEAGAAGHALVLGAVQLLASAAALYLLERVGRRPLLVWGAAATGACLALGAGAAAAGRGAGWAGWALAGAVAADSLGLQPAPYAILADMFHYQYRGCAVLLVMAAGSAGNAAETLLFPGVVHAAGLWPALALAAALTLLYALFALACVPETRGRDPEDIYAAMSPHTPDAEVGDTLKSKNSIARNKDSNTANASAAVTPSITQTDGTDATEPKTGLPGSRRISSDEGDMNHCEVKTHFNNHKSLAKCNDDKENISNISFEQTHESHTISFNDSEKDKVTDDSKNGEKDKVTDDSKNSEKGEVTDDSKICEKNHVIRDSKIRKNYQLIDEFKNSGKYQVSDDSRNSGVATKKCSAIFRGVQ